MPNTAERDPNNPGYYECTGNCSNVKASGTDTYTAFTTPKSADIVPGLSSAPPGSDAAKAAAGQKPSSPGTTTTAPIDQTTQTTVLDPTKAQGSTPAIPKGSSAKDVTTGTITYTTYADG